MYFAVWWNVIKNKEWYNKHYYKFLPRENGDKNGSGAGSNSVCDTKKLLDCCVERHADNMIALDPPCYSVFNSNVNEINKIKRLDLTNNDFKHNDYEEMLDTGIVKSGVNRTLWFKNNQLQIIETTKKSLTVFHNKMVVLSNNSCAPFVQGLRFEDYIVE